MHTLKGSGASAGFRRLANFVHHVEEVFNRIRNKQLEATPELIDATLKACDCCVLLLKLGSTEDDTPLPLETEVLAAIRPFLPEVDKATSKAQATPVAPSVAARYKIGFRPNREIFFSGTDPASLLLELTDLGEMDIRCEDVYKRQAIGRNRSRSRRRTGRTSQEAPAMELTAEQFTKLSKLIYKKLGLQFDEKKIYFLNKRVERRIVHLNLKTADEYIFQLGYCDSQGKEMQALANLITTNETYMFREFEQLAGFADVCLPELIAARQKTSEKRIRIWCAGCSSGEEAYTLAIIIREVFPDSRNWDIKITATDIDENVLNLARNATYGELSLIHI